MSHFLKKFINKLKTTVNYPKSDSIQRFLHKKNFDYDLIVIGGGSGGLAAAKEASFLGAQVAIIDYVAPTPTGTTWGLGGTCANVGCIPKKLMHQSALLGEALEDAKKYGWKFDPLLFDNNNNKNKIIHQWQHFRDAVQSHIKSINWTTKIELRDKNIRYLNGIGKFENSHTIRVTTTNNNKDDTYLTAKYLLIAVGGRPKYPDIPGAVKFGITSDDIFSLEEPPGKTLIIGAGYVGLECAGALNSFGYDLNVLVRSVPLRGFDQQMAKFITKEMLNQGVKFLYGTPKEIRKLTNGKLKVKWLNNEHNKIDSEIFDTVMFAVGKRALTEDLHLYNAGVLTVPENGKINTINEQTNIPNIYAVGDVLHMKPELTPVAIQAGILLARRLFGKSNEFMDYQNVATTIFTPLEYGFVGLSEENALEKFGESNIEIFHSFYKPIEYSLCKRDVSNCYLKIIAMRKDKRKIIGMHFIGPQAGEVIQGFSTAIKCDLTVDSLLNTVGIHPTVAEEFTKLNITKRSGRNPIPASCCS